MVFAGIFRAAATGRPLPFTDTAVIDRTDGDVHIHCPEGLSGSLTAAGTAVRILAGITVHPAAGNFHR